MFGRSWWIAILVLVLLHFGFPFKVHAQTGTAGLKYTAGTGQRQIVVGSDSTQYLLGGSASGMSVNDTQRDRNYTTGLTQLITAATLAPGGTASAAAAAPFAEYTSLMVFVSWNCAAADTDSVAFGLTFTGKISTSANDGFDWLFSPQDTASFARADTVCNTLAASLVPGVIGYPHTVYVISRLKSTDGGAAGATARLGPSGNPGCYDLYAPNTTAVAATRGRIYHVPMQRVVWADGHYGVCFPLSVPSGAPVKFSHLMVKVQNLNRLQTYTNITVNVWPKVN